MARTTAALVFVLCACSGAWAETTPTEALQDVFARANAVLTDPESDERPLERLLAVRRLVNEAFDFRGAAELASGDHWRARSAAEQEEFTWLFSDLLERGFVSRMASKASLSGGTKIRYLDESLDGDTAIVLTAMARRNGGELLLDYHLVERDGGWKIRDVAIDGVSLMANYRAQLDRVLGNASFPELLSQMRAKVGIVDVPPAEPPAAAVATVEEAAPPISTVAVADVAPPGPEIVAVTFVPVFRVPVTPAPTIAVAIKPSARPPDEPMTPPAPAPSPVEPPRSTPLTRVTTKAYWLRMMAAGTVEEAGRLVSQLRADKFPTAVNRTSGQGKLTVAVRVGPFRDAEEAVLQLLTLQTKGHNPYLVAERN